MADGSADDLQQQLNALAERKGMSVERLLREWIAAESAPENLSDSSFRTLVENNPDFIARFDRSRRYLYVNAALEQATGHTLAEHFGKTPLEMREPVDLNRFVYDHLQRVLESGETKHLTFAYPSEEGAHFELRLIPEMDVEGVIQSVLAISRDISHQKQMERRLYESEARYRAIVQSQLDMVCRYTPDTVLTFVNDAYCHFFQRTREELIGRSFLTTSPPDQHAAIWRRVEILRHDPSPEVALYRSVVPNGEELWIQWVDHGIVNEQGQVVEVQAVGRDVTKLRQLEDERVRSAALAAELAKEREVIELKNQFISMVSHEFRTPLGIIKTSDDLIRRYIDRMSPDQIEEHLDRISQQVVQMTQLLDDVLALDPTRANLFELNPQPIDVVDFCQSLVEHLQLLDNNQHPVLVEMRQQAGEVVADIRFLNRILSNLLSNAFKYSPPGSTVRLTIEQDQHDLIIEVQDQGIGIPEPDQAQIFEPFFRAKNVRTVSGTGLGLAIVRQHIEAHGGSITLASQPGQGTTFFVRLPL
ncbi:MAG: PAS domain-containing sensor histidine kinase [Anaerolineae bacterium]|nr:PAS domain-containing sensor histidine kinase [Anaerolineae bacterium]